MKYYSRIILALLVLSSCGAPSELDTLAKKEEELQGKIKELSDELETVQSQLKVLRSANDTTPDARNLVRIIELQPSVFKHAIDIQGLVSTNFNVTLSAENGGKVLQIHVKEGQRVTKGQKLVDLDGSVIENNLGELRTRLQLAKQLFEKQERLYKQEIGTELQYLQAKNNFEALKNQEASLLATLSKFQLRAPISGVVDEIMVNVGELTAPGLPVVRVVELTELEAVADVSERYVGSIKAGDKVSVYFPALQDTIIANISAVSQVINPNNRTFSLRVPLKGNHPGIKPNLLAIIQAVDFYQEEAIQVPANLIQTRGGEKFVLVAVANGNDLIAEKRNVVTGPSSGGSIFIESGLQAGDKVISDGYLSIEPGDKLQIN